MKPSPKPVAPDAATASDIGLPAAPADGHAAAVHTPRADDPAAEQQASDEATREERIRQAAYARWQQRGGESGDHHTDWLDAEADIARTDPDPATMAP